MSALDQTCCPVCQRPRGRCAASAWRSVALLHHRVFAGAAADDEARQMAERRNREADECDAVANRAAEVILAAGGGE